ncbi:hypothetical protein ACFVFS_36060 [Kitasatospora sp. NPDC057692]|uniref:hypothetical protein n=1 Tax=Kitasatospora sp. NPDC057692 TaxID=3346215 RepID=UPI00367E862D
MRHSEPITPLPYAHIENTLWTRDFDSRTSDCQCPWRDYRGCVDDLPLPPRLGLYIHPDGRRGSFVRRWRRHDPDTLAIVQTAVVFRHHNADGSVVEWSLKCARLGPAA